MTNKPAVAIINGPNLSRLGIREPDLYGSTDEKDLKDLLEKRAVELGFDVNLKQFDCEGDIIRAIWEASDTSQALIINPGGYSHYSVAILDAVRSFRGPVIEVHISQVFSREPFRSRLVTAAGASSLIIGAGILGYSLALDIIRDRLTGIDTC